MNERETEIVEEKQEWKKYMPSGRYKEMRAYRDEAGSINEGNEAKTAIISESVAFLATRVGT